MSEYISKETEGLLDQLRIQTRKEIGKRYFLIFVQGSDCLVDYGFPAEGIQNIESIIGVLGSAGGIVSSLIEAFAKDIGTNSGDMNEQEFRRLVSEAILKTSSEHDLSVKKSNRGRPESPYEEC